MSSYQLLASAEDVENAIAKSWECPILIFKHSTMCPISARAHDAYRDFTQDPGENPVSCYLVKVIEDRSISRLITEKLGVEHHSPQAILIEKGKPVWVTTHRSITEENLRKACESKE